MNIRPAISVPLPWLTSIIGKTLSNRRPGAQRQKSLFKLPRSLSITREGKWFIGILLLIGIAAINTGNNLLYLVVAALLSLIVISGVMSEATLRGVKAVRTMPERVSKGAPVPVRVSVHNGNRLLPSFSFIVKEAAAPGVEARPAYILKLKAGGSVVKKTDYLFRNRGRVTLSGLKVATRFPFGLFLKGKEEESSAEVLVWPAIRKPGRQYLGNGRGINEGPAVFKKGGGRELHNLRDYTLQDDSRFIYWRSAAKTSKILMKEFERESVKKVIIVFDNRASKGHMEAFEEMADEAASLAVHFIQKGCSVGLRTLAGTVPPGSGMGQTRRLLDTLAVIGPAGGEGMPEVRVVYQ
ncbi:MAG: DUF58 domain-containing protein [Deltaproteobacteria bacterium]|nr:DUF58 domain-containing protein [Deltaproteobacteria bacterium]